ncbi:hypothetical protein A3D06_01690 [Candidatus Roizmanbacteria bacterium RIFCSPHIGHO2_02_FULL_40_9]|uniref:Small ribosomal subunit protein uS5 n=2 Tax=Candidatus Roizmaniibacteriota TaxID=1752723 RepID=A0A1F7IKZ8_9BACT|nr:MAG: hypothetical protein A3D06_01690 [Candidatus Roizmanbacteria bacterium RIFCSPHIGHO2_02_FULL_40_9]OGK44022.1 MAG: hypothetical protein A2957_01640 [Candidatus Roizmanbacteria bacterium RIFCSPLOWO2_01_FULL_38_11]
MAREEKRPTQDGLEENVLLIRRLSKKTKGGNYVSFSALVVVGDRKGRVGVGMGRGLEVPQAIRKALVQARKHMITVPLYNATLPHDIRVKYKSAELILYPAPQGAGLKVGSVVRAILSYAGITNASGKILRSRNQITNAHAVVKALKMLRPRY